ncbi:aromatic acid exporter family member 1 [Streptomyces sp. PsTaAH-130]|nr:aromatic acid exporter family member 1 [Streptomyces sp. PsTaAH-130]
MGTWEIRNQFGQVFMGMAGGLPAAWARRSVGYARAALRSPGPERDDVVLLGKSVAAATAAWSVARWLLPSTVWSFAPLTALLVLQATVYRSLRHGAQYVTALGVGVGLAAGLASWAGVQVWTFALLMLAALLLARPRPLGAYGFQVVAVAIFAFNAGQGRIAYVGHLTAAVAIGAACGALAHAMAAPARRPLHRRERVARLYERLADVLRDIGEGLLDGDDRVALRASGQWRSNAAQLSGEAEHAEDAVAAEQENAWFNPRRDPTDSRHLLPRTRCAVRIAHLCVSHVRSLTRTLDHARADGQEGCLTRSFRTGYAESLNFLADALEHVGRVERTDTDALDTVLRRARDPLSGLDTLPACTDGSCHDCLILRGALVNDAARIAVELDHAATDMDHAEEAARAPRHPRRGNRSASSAHAA